MDFMNMMQPEEPNPMMQQEDPMQAMMEQVVAEVEFEQAIQRFVDEGEPAEYSDEAKDKMVRLICEKKVFAESTMESRYRKWEDIKEAYEMRKPYTVPSGVHEPESRVSTPLMAKRVNKLVQMLTIRMVQPFMNFIAVKDRVSQIRNYKIANFLFRMFVKNKMSIEIVKAAKSAVLFSMGFTKVIPVYESNEPDCRVECVSNFDILIDPDARNIDDASFIIHRVFIPHNVLLSRRGTVYDADAVDEMVKWCNRRYDDENLISSMGSDETVRASARRTGERQTGKYNKLPDTLYADDEYSGDSYDRDPRIEQKYDRYTLYEYFDGENIVTIGEEKFFLRSRKNVIGYPFQAWFFDPAILDDFWNRGHGELLLPIQEESNIKRNQRIESLNKQINKPMFYNKGMFDETDIDKIIIDSGSKIEVKDVTGILFPEQSDPTSNMLEELQYLDAEADDITSAGPVIFGEVAKKERMTTQESEAIYSNVAIPFDFGSSIMVTTGLIPMLEKILEICGQLFKRKPAAASMAKNQIGSVMPITPEEFLGDWDITVSINPTQEEQNKGEAKEMFQMLMTDPMINPIALRWQLLPIIYPEFAWEELIMNQPMMPPSPEQVQLKS